MGQTAENLHDEFPQLTKEAADAYAVESQRRAGKAWDEGVMDEIVVPMSVFTDEGWQVADRDEFLRPDTTLEALATLRTPFRAGGRVTAGNSAGLTDGATAALIASKDAAAELGLEPKMRLVGFAYAGVEPHLMGLGPVPATQKGSERTGLTIDDLDLFELNEPFAVQVLTWCDGMGVSPDDPRLNPYGGAIACGHPLAATGVRLMAQLARGFRDRPGSRHGLTALCIGMGMGAALPLGEPARRWLATRRSSSCSGSTRGAGPIALVTMDNGEDWQKPNTFGESALRSLESVLDQLRSRDWRGLLLTGKPFVFAVGADIGEFGEITPDRARLGGQAGHELFGRIRDLPFVTVAAVNGAALGGGVEIALHCDYRTIASSVRHFACPEVFLGLIPGWGGTQLVPQLVGAEQAVTFVVENPLRQNRMLDARRAFDAGFADALLEPVEFLDESLAFLLEKVEEDAGKRRPAADLSDVAEVCRKARSRLDGQVHGATPAPYRALDLIEGSATWSLEDGYRAEEDALADLLPGPEAQASVYAFNLVERRAKRGVGMPDAEPRRVQRVGVVGAGLMARQLALLFLRRLEVPVVLRDLSQEQVDDAVAWIADELGELVRRGRLGEGKARFLGSLVTGGTGWDVFEGCDLVLEAVFEEMPVKKEVFAELEKVVRPSASSQRIRRRSRSPRWAPTSSIRSVSSACTSSTRWRSCRSWSSRARRRRTTSRSRQCGPSRRSFGRPASSSATRPPSS